MKRQRELLRRSNCLFCLFFNYISSHSYFFFCIYVFIDDFCQYLSIIDTKIFTIKTFVLLLFFSGM